MARDEQYWTQDKIDVYGAQLVAAEHAGQSGPGIGIGILVVLALIVGGAFLCGAPLSIVNSKVQTDKAEAETQLVHAEADLVIADARAEAELIRAEADAELLLAYNKVASLALNTDIRRSHPELAIKEIATQLCLGALILIACVTVSAVVFVYSYDWKERNNNER